jgi:hypothetical protein
MLTRHPDSLRAVRRRLVLLLVAGMSVKRIRNGVISNNMKNSSTPPPVSRGCFTAVKLHLSSRKPFNEVHNQVPPAKLPIMVVTERQPVEEVVLGSSSAFPLLAPSLAVPGLPELEPTASLRVEPPHQSDGERPPSTFNVAVVRRDLCGINTDTKASSQGSPVHSKTAVARSSSSGKLATKYIQERRIRRSPSIGRLRFPDSRTACTSSLSAEFAKTAVLRPLSDSLWKING